MIRWLIFAALLVHVTSAKKSDDGGVGAAKKWPTLHGNQPAVVARGGFSGLFPESSDYATQMAIQTSISDVIILCNLQLTKDSVGICLSDIRLDNSTNIDQVYANQSKTYNVNGQDVTGWFPVDYTTEQLLSNVSLMQSTLSRPSLFDNQLPIATVEDVAGAKPPALWLNVQYDAFYTQHKLNVASYLQKAMAGRLRGVNYISSPEIGFLKTMSTKVSKGTKLIFVFLQKDATEPTTKQTYGDILEKLDTIKPLVSGIVVPKDYIWPVNKANYLDAPTTLVADVHKKGLEVYASGFANDYTTSFNYSYDPSAEYLQFINNPQFSVDGLITDFPPTASEAVACFAEYNPTKPSKGQALIITHNGASGVYAGSTDLAYEQSLTDGADIIDCSVQMSKDGIAFCMDSIDVTGDTTATATFMDRSATIPELQQPAGIFSFALSWSEIQTLKPQLTSPFATNAGFPRNPANKNMGKFLTFTDFLEFAKTKAVSGILINIENAAYLATQGLDIVGAVNSALSNATFDKQSTQQVLIQSDDTSVLSKFQGVPAYKRVLYLEEEISEAPGKPVDEIKKYADAVTLSRFSIIPTTADGFTKPATKVVQEMHAANISVYVSVLRNEYIALAFDYFADPTIEVVTYIAGIGVDGVVTEFPATANRYLRNPCSNLKANIPYPILPAEPGALLGLIPVAAQAPASAPRPALDVADVVDPPLPAVSKVTPNTTGADAPAPRSSASLASVANIGLSLVAIVVFSLLSIGY